MEIDFNEIKDFKGPFEEIGFTDPQELPPCKLFFLGKMDQTEKISYSLFARKLRESEEMYSETFKSIVLSKAPVDDELIVMQKIQALAEASDNWYFFLEQHTRERFSVFHKKGVMFLPGFFIVSIDIINQSTDLGFCEEKEEEVFIV